MKNFGLFFFNGIVLFIDIVSLLLVVCRIIELSTKVNSKGIGWFWKIS